jgi:hypothetical protein
MSRILTLVLFAGALASSGLLAQESGGPKPPVTKDKPKATVTFAKTWDAALEEAKLLNVPIVVHSHGFY